MDDRTLRAKRDQCLLWDINDLGIGNGWCGSVLAPALAVNCYWALLVTTGGREDRKRFTKKSTDGSSFIHLACFISNSWKTMVKAIEALCHSLKLKSRSSFTRQKGLIDSLPKESKMCLQKSGFEFETVDNHV
ncbi:hypothetical protein [Dubosiella newyorkensis]|uniref:hypothetical protein n=1 Tax=Dubosiella newyorkensis TaxID=1862672 RepID=UPI003F66EEC0